MSIFKPKYTVQSVAQIILDGLRDDEIELPQKHWYDTNENGEIACNGSADEKARSGSDNQPRKSKLANED